MFNEIDPRLIKNDETGLQRRWLRDAERNCDLFVWLDRRKEIVKFQFWLNEALVEWTLNKGMSTGRMNQHSGAFIHMQAPVFRYHEQASANLIQSIRAALGNITETETGSAEILDLVIAELQKFNETGR